MWARRGFKPPLQMWKIKVFLRMKGSQEKHNWNEGAQGEGSAALLAFKQAIHSLCSLPSQILPGPFTPLCMLLHPDQQHAIN